MVENAVFTFALVKLLVAEGADAHAVIAELKRHGVSATVALTVFNLVVQG